MVLCTTYMAFVYMNTHDITSTIAHVGISCWYKQFVPLFNRHRQVSVTSQSQHQHPATIYCYKHMRPCVICVHNQPRLLADTMEFSGPDGIFTTNTWVHRLFVYTNNSNIWPQSFRHTKAQFQQSCTQPNGLSQWKIWKAWSIRVALCSCHTNALSVASESW